MTKPTVANDMEKSTGTPSQETTQSLLDLGAALTKSPRGAIYCLTIIGQIEGHSEAPNSAKTTKYEHILPLLARLEQAGEVDGVLFLLNTVGGDVEAGLAIAELMAGMRKPTATLVLGGSHSIGIPLAVAGGRSFAVPSAAMTVHPLRTSGTVIAAPQTYRYFERLQERIVSFVAGHSGISAQAFQDLMFRAEDMAADVGTILYGEEAVSCGAWLSFFQGEAVVLAVGGDGGAVTLGAGVAGDVLHRHHGVRQDLKLRRGAAFHGLLHQNDRGGAGISAGVDHAFSSFPGRWVRATASRMTKQRITATLPLFPMPPMT